MAETIPFTAWEQAVFVVLFIVMVVTLLSWFAKQQKSWQDFMNDQNNRWQKSIDELNAQWQKWLAEQNVRECASMEKVSASLEKLTERLEEHDDKVESRLNDAVDKIIKRPKKSK